MKIADLKNPYDDMEIITARSLQEIEKLRSAWQLMQSKERLPVPNADIDGYLAVVSSLKEVERPHVILMCRDHVPRAMILGRIEKLRIKCAIGYWNILNPRMRSLTIGYGGILGNPDEATCRAITRQLQSVLRNKEADVVFLNQLRTDLPLYQFLRTAPGFWCRKWICKDNIHRSMTIPRDIEDFYQRLSKKHRGNLRRAIKKLDHEYPDQVSMVKYCQEKEVEEAINIISQISSKTYQCALGVGFVDNDLMRGTLRANARHDRFCAYVLFIGGDPCAFQVMTFYKNTCFLLAIGFDPRWKQFGAGTVLFLKSLEDICKEHRVDCMDFYYGDADYKKSYGDKVWTEKTVYLFAPRFYPVCINIINSLMDRLSQSGKLIVSKVGLLNRIKKYWRDHLRKKMLKT